MLGGVRVTFPGRVGHSCLRYAKVPVSLLRKLQGPQTKPCKGYCPNPWQRQTEFQKFSHIRCRGRLASVYIEASSPQSRIICAQWPVVNRSQGPLIGSLPLGNRSSENGRAGAAERRHPEEEPTAGLRTHPEGGQRDLRRCVQGK